METRKKSEFPVTLVLKLWSMQVLYKLQDCGKHQLIPFPCKYKSTSVGFSASGLRSAEV